MAANNSLRDEKATLNIDQKEAVINVQTAKLHLSFLLYFLYQLVSTIQ